MPIATRITNTGTLLVNGSFDENTSIAPSKFSTTSNTVFAGMLDEFTGAPVVDSSLKVWLDAAQTTSYSGSGTTWTDLSGSGNNGTLVNGVTFDAIDGGGSFSLDGSNDHISIGTTGVAASTVTIETWVKKKGNNGHFFVIDNFDQPELRFQFTSNGLEILFYDNGAYFTSTTYNPAGGFDTNLWYHIVATLENGSQKYYVNGSLVVSTSGAYDGSITTNAGEHTLGTYNRPGAGYNGYANVKYAVHKIYNRVLTQAEVITNYNALRGRFSLPVVTSSQMTVVERKLSSGTLLVNGEFDEVEWNPPIVTSGLILNLDAGIPTSYPGTGTTWTDLSGNGNNGTLVNSPTYFYNNGYFSFGSGASQRTSFTYQTPVQSASTAFTWNIWTYPVANQDGYVLMGYRGTTPLQFYKLTTQKFEMYPAEIFYLFTLNVWQNICVIYDGTQSGTNNMKMYVNGTQVGVRDADSPDLSPSTMPFYVGGDPIASEFATARIAQVMVYHRALSTNEITTNFNALRNRYGI